MRARVICDVCDETLHAIAATPGRAEQFVLQGCLVGCHAANPHQGHRLRIEIDDEPAPMRTDRWTIRCLQPGCKAPLAEQVIEDLPAELVGVAAIAFHTSHEGHRFRAQWGDFVFESPAMRP